MIVNVRSLATVVGQIISLTPCVGGVARIMTRSLYAVVTKTVVEFYCGIDKGGLQR